MKAVRFDDPAFDASLVYHVPATLRAVRPPPRPIVQAVAPWTPHAQKELINPWRYWTVQASAGSLEKEIRTDGPVAGPAGRRVTRVSGNFGRGSSLNHSFGNGIKLDPGRYRFALRVRGTPGQFVEFELVDGGRRLSTEARIPLTDEWHEHIVQFEIRNTFKEDTTLRFSLPREITGTFDLTDPRWVSQR